jgi:glycosyltransferase involved in cell wall biosynthesis
MPPSIRERDVRVVTSLKPFKRLRKILLPILPFVVESLALEGYDLVISTSSCVAKGAIVGPQGRHLCYLHSPMRYVWDQRAHYFESFLRIPILAQLVHIMGTWLRCWDTLSAARVDRFVCNSSFVAERVTRYYRREASVVPPPVEWSRFQAPPPARSAREPYFLAAGAFVSYKRFDLAIKAAKLSQKRLVIAGAGPEEARLRALAGPETEFVLSPERDRWVSLMAGAEALLFCGVEDFGIVAIEAMAAGTPVVALRAGGALDFIRPGETGEFFAEPTAESLADVLGSFSKAAFDGQLLRGFARQYDKVEFLQRMRHEIALLAPSPPA